MLAAQLQFKQQAAPECDCVISIQMMQAGIEQRHRTDECVISIQMMQAGIEQRPRTDESSEQPPGSTLISGGTRLYQDDLWRAMAQRAD